MLKWAHNPALRPGPGLRPSLRQEAGPSSTPRGLHVSWEEDDLAGRKEPSSGALASRRKSLGSLPLWQTKEVPIQELCTKDPLLKESRSKELHLQVARSRGSPLKRSLTWNLGFTAWRSLKVLGRGKLGGGEKAGEEDGEDEQAGEVDAVKNKEAGEEEHAGEAGEEERAGEAGEEEHAGEAGEEEHTGEAGEEGKEVAGERENGLKKDVEEIIEKERKEKTKVGAFGGNMFGYQENAAKGAFDKTFDKTKRNILENMNDNAVDVTEDQSDNVEENNTEICENIETEIICQYNTEVENQKDKIENTCVIPKIDVNGLKWRKDAFGMVSFAALEDVIETCNDDDGLETSTEMSDVLAELETIKRRIEEIEKIIQTK